MTDPIATAGLREGVLAAWTSSPTRFREDANAEDDLVRGAYRDRLVVELAQNAADAASVAMIGGHLQLRLTDTALLASNTGAPLTRAGVESLSSLRASAKARRSGGSAADRASVGRFGVGFAAVLAITDEPRVRSRDGGVAFSASATRGAVAAHPELADEVTRRAGQVSILRLPFACTEPPEEGFATTVELPLRDVDARATARAALAAVDQSLLLVLPSLTQITITVDDQVRVLRRISDAGADQAAPASTTIVEEIDDTTLATTWHLHSGSTTVGPELLRDLTVEEARRTDWSWTWAVPVDENGAPTPLPASVPPVLHAPTRTDEPIDLPALLMAALPLQASRRDVLPGALTDALLTDVARSYVEVIAASARAVGPAALSLIPAPAGRGVVDGRLRTLIRSALPDHAVVPAADDDRRQPVPGTTLCALDVADADLIAVLADSYAGLVDAAWLTDRSALAALGIAPIQLSDLLEELAGVQRPPAWWRQVYVELDRLLSGGAVTPTALEGLPVPLADGRMVRGPRGALVADAPDQAPFLVDLGLRVVDPEAQHRLLERLGARAAAPDTVLADPAIRASVNGSASGDADDPGALAAAVLGLLRPVPELAAAHPWLRRLALLDSDGHWSPAADLLLPDAVLAADVEPDAIAMVHPGVVEEYGRDLLVAVGVVDDLAALTAYDMTLDADLVEAQLDADDAEAAQEVDGFVDWVDAVSSQIGSEEPSTAAEVTVITDLDLIRDDAWPAVLPRLADSPARAAVTSPTRIVTARGGVRQVRGYAAWWLAESALLDGQPLRSYRLADADAVLRPLYPVVPGVADVEFLAAAGVRRRVDDLLAEPGGAAELLHRLLSPPADLTAGQLAAGYAALAAWAQDAPEPSWPQAPDLLRVASGSSTTLAARIDCVLVTAPHHVPLAEGHFLTGSVALAHLLEIDLLQPAGALAGEGIVRPLPGALAQVLPDVTSYREHDDLVVDGVAVDWWIDDADELHAATLHGLARALAWRTGQWGRRYQFAAVLADPDGWDAQAETAFDA